MHSPPPNAAPRVHAEHWVHHAAADLQALSRDSDPALRRRLDRVLERLARGNGGTSIASALTRPAATPFVALIDAVAADLGLGGDPRVGTVGLATLMLYAYVRVQDDLVDEPRRVERPSAYAAEALLARHLAAMGQVVPDPRFWTWRAAIMHRFAEVALREVDDRRRARTRQADLRWMGEKFLPMAVPLAGLALIAERPEAAGDLVELTVDLGVALQVLNDLYNADEDAATGRVTPVLDWLGPCEGSRKATLVGHPTLERALGVARDSLARARARAADMPATLALVDGVAAMVEAAPLRLLRLTLGAAP